MFKIIMATVLVGFSMIAIAHDGHDHSPGQVQAPKGGQLSTMETVSLELLVQGKEIRIYAYDPQLNPEQVSKFPVSATVTLPRGKPQPLTLEQKGDHWAAEFDGKGTHRYTIDLSIHQGGHDDKIQFIVEPSR